jgi:hypothetical protein
MLTSSFTLLLAFFMAPYQHVHLGIHPDDHDDHDAGAIVHVHFYAEPVASNPSNGSNLEDSDRDHRSRPLDTFAIMLQAGFPPFGALSRRFFSFLRRICLQGSSRSPSLAVTIRPVLISPSRVPLPPSLR